MFKVKLTKRELKRHDGTMTVDVNFFDGVESFTKSFVLPINSSIDDIKVVAKEYIEDYEDGVALVLDPQEEIDLTPTQSERTPERNYQKKKRELEKYMALVVLGVFDTNDAAIVALRADVKNKFKPKYK